ncbi:ABC transporter substrate-binding protein [Streptomonospora nanhaiensis]|uniref:Multiple sugar transport system substrate-binding protein n=1 Tax=Streptomonospora nanhaiensis TaxID=1323731 RepID=A0A853BH74_9ACTN|nr:ABC transporter substrate-binding protein [Streptomonospora nanhaiensis]MBV2364451.1 ABC transporter substrate-binding protein [Streptomonospora nanhaiensis]MBX9387893.1 ABC transporter substrate-binding protein [Streptomonospora nanhaiensis]NYI94085.1 multiple sugar transport system substrate-binding protein [Streptomonospora nanhaiensis]
MHLSRRGLLTGGVVLAATALAGCGGDARPPVTAADIAPPTEPVTIDWMAPELLTNDGKDLRRSLVRAFQKRFPNITVRLVQVPPTTDVRRTTLTTQIASGAVTPDVYLGDCAWPAQFAHNSLAMPLGRVADDEEFWSGYPEEVVSSISYQGQVYAFPCYLDLAFLYYRADLLDKHGLEVPATWEELRRTALRLIDTGDVRYGLVWQGMSGEPLTCNVSEFVADAGGALMDLRARRVRVDSPEARRALTFMTELVSEGVSPEAVGTFAEEQTLTAFAGGQAAFLRNWSYAWGSANDPESSLVAGKVGAVLRPTFEGAGTERHSTLGGWHNFVNPHTAHPGAAVAFARWVAEEEAQTLMAATSPYLPTLSAVLDNPRIAGPDKPTNRLSADAAIVLRPFGSPHYPAISKAIYTDVNRLLVDGADPGAVGDTLTEMAQGMALARDGVAL